MEMALKSPLSDSVTYRMDSAVSTGPEPAVVKPTTRKPDLRLRASAANLVHFLFGLLGGALVLVFMVVEREILLALPGLLLLAYGLNTVGAVTVKDGVLRKRSLFKTLEIPVDDVREIGLGQLRLPPTKYWMPVVDTFDGDSIVLTSAMTMSKGSSVDRVRALRTALGADPRTADRFAGTNFRPKKTAQVEAKRQLSGYEEYLLMKEADAAVPTAPEANDVPQAAPTGLRPEEPEFNTAWTDDASDHAEDSPQVLEEPAPEVFTPRPLNPRQEPPRRPKPQTMPAEPSVDLRQAPSAVPEAPSQASSPISLFGTPPAAPTSQPAAATAAPSPPAAPSNGITRLFGSEPKAEPKPKGITSLFGSSTPTKNPNPEPERIVTLFGSVKQERSPLKSLFGSSAGESAATGWSDVA